MGVEGAEKRFALLQAARDSEYVKKMYGGYFNLFVEAFGEEGERWDLFMVVEGEFPLLTDLQNYDGFVVSGSPYDAYGDDCWIRELCVLLQAIDSLQKKLLGICFGHQVIILHVCLLILAKIVLTNKYHNEFTTHKWSAIYSSWFFCN